MALKDYIAKLMRNDLDKDSELKSLIKPSKKDKGVNKPEFYQIKPDFIVQADILYLPHDKSGAKYALVVVDQGGKRLVDAEPLKTKSAKATLEAIQKIFNRGIVNEPKRQINTDPGSEFKGVFNQYFKDKGIYHKFGIPGRHRQQSLAEARNKQIGGTIIKLLQARELLTKKIQTDWVNDLPVIIEVLNDHLKKQKIKKMPETAECEGDSCVLLPIGATVRIPLEEPRDIHHKKLPGKFRTGDLRFSSDLYRIINIDLLPGNPPLYQVQNITNKNIPKVRYTKNNLRHVQGPQKAPKGRVIFSDEPEQFVIEKILDDRMKNNKKEYLIKWKGYSKKEATWEPSAKINKSAPVLVREYNS